MKFLRHQALLLAGLLFGTSVGFGQVSKLAPDLLSLVADATKPVKVVVQYSTVPTLLNILNLQALGGIITQRYTSIPAVAVTLPAIVVPVVALDPTVAYISPDRELTGTLDLSTAASGADIAYQSGYTGKGIGIAIIDSGIYNHPDLASRIVYRQSFVAGLNLDDYGHGTHVAGISQVAEHRRPVRNLRGRFAASRRART